MIQMKEKIDNINNAFKEHFSNLGYSQENSVLITSGVDRSVAFIGSTISVLKPKFLGDTIDEKGNFLCQRAIRTRSLKNILIPEKLEWSSYFDALGVLTKYDNLEKIINDTLTFLYDKLDTNYDDLLIRASSRDVDMIDAINDLNQNVRIELDTQPIKYYTHKYGLQDYGIYGRNFNIAIKEKETGSYKDIGNIIVIESETKKYGVEFAAGVNALIMRKEKLSTSLEASSISDIIKLDSLEKYKFADCVSVVSHLAFENVERLKSSKSDRSLIYLYRKYLKALKMWQEIINLSDEELYQIIENYLVLEYNKVDTDTLNSNIQLTKKLREV